jgi:hypothetical protein
MLFGCCASAAAANSPVKAAAMTIRFNIGGLLHLDMIGPAQNPKAVFAEPAIRSGDRNRA